MISLELVEKVNQLKELYPSSTTRIDSTIAHNRAEGGKVNSWHLHGKAIDLIYDSVELLLPAALYARTIGFGGIEVDYRN